jgi:hypothetical protein
VLQTKYTTYAESHPKSYSVLIVQGWLTTQMLTLKTETIFNGLEESLKTLAGICKTKLTESILLLLVLLPQLET